MQVVLLDDLSTANITSQEVFKSLNDIRQLVGESVDSLIDPINALDEQMPVQPEQTQIHTRMFRSAQD